MKKMAKWIVGITSVATATGTLGLIQMGANQVPATDSAPPAQQGTNENVPMQSDPTESNALSFDYYIGVKKDFLSIPYYLSDETAVQGLTEAELKEFFQTREAFLASLDWEDTFSTSPGVTRGNPSINPGGSTPSIQPDQRPSISQSFGSVRRSRGSRR